MEDKYLSLNQLLKGICECHSISDRIKVKWKNRQYQGSLHPFLLVQLLFFAFQVVSSQPQDGVIVTLADYQSLQAIKHEFIDFKGVLRSWNDSGYGACSGGWAGIKCAQGQVIAIQLPWKGLGGRISEKIGQLQSLRKLSLHNNVLSGAVPFSLGFLPNLRGVYLFNNRLSGSIPPSIGYCTLLQTLDVSNNLLTGSIPPSLANSTKLYRLNFSFNSLSGSLPVSFTHSRSLIFLALQKNNLSGSIPDSWSGTEKNIHRLQYLTLDHNLFSGHIPASIGNISSITQLDLSNNDITGEIPTSFANLPNLNSFNVSYNNLSGSVPSLLLNKFNSSSFVGNLQLCGYSNSTQCPSPSPSPSPSPYSLAIPPSGEHERHHRRKLSTKDIILIAAGVLLIVLLVLCCLLLCCLIRKRTASKEKNGKSGLPSTGRGGDKAVPTAGAEVDSGGEAGGKLVHFDGPFLFTADDLLCATAEIMGKSTYGTAYKATLEDGHQVAVKRLREKITKSPREFETEVAALGKIRHPNLLALRAYYLGPKGEKLLVFDYMPNGSLASFLHARGPETTINWPTRMNIAMGVARGLCYLHSQANIIHGNLTSSNILLDEQTNPHVAHFGLSRLMTTATANTSVNATAGAQGYTAPELSKLKQANTKSDVYSLGVIILELLTGKSPSEAMNGGGDLPQWVASIVKEEWTNEVFDLELMKDASTTIGDELLNTLKLSLHCVDPSPAARPEVEQVLGQLEEIKLELVASSGEEGAGFSATNE